jgi:hypothetical protein
MVNFLYQTEHPQLNYEVFFEIMRDYRKGGLTPANYDEFIDLVKNLPPIVKRTPNDYKVFSKFNLKDIANEEFGVIMREILKRAAEKSKKCWHPNASSATCKVDNNGDVIISAAHSIQNNGVLSKIAKDGHVMTFAKDKAGFEGKKLGKKLASIFWGFCNIHDSIFQPIENFPYTQTEEQNFLYAYRGFVVASHKKVEIASFINFGDQADNDIIRNKAIFDKAILENNYSIIETDVIELPMFYPIAVSSNFYLDFDFEANPIEHSEFRMENIFVSVFPDNSKTYFLLSYFKEDKHLYENLAKQLKKRNNLKSDITVLLAAHVENIYFEPVYFETFIDKQSDALEKVFFEAQFDCNYIDEDNNINTGFSFTPNDYLSNQYNIDFFGY